jgi:hypothetical protein
LPQKEKRWHAEEAWPKKKRERERKGAAISEKKETRDDKREREPML